MSVVAAVDGPSLILAIIVIAVLGVVLVSIAPMVFDIDWSEAPLFLGIATGCALIGWVLFGSGLVTW